MSRRWLPLLAALALFAAAPAASGYSWHRAGQDFRAAAHDTGHAIVNGVHATGHALRDAAHATGRAFHRLFHHG